ncbi:MAG TPA: acyl-phosphate glycerol 3-phosphate acyltransferase [Chromatiales bacterium]|nr:acyl-phosphate glycerol 3-phosphate acyltransferase [Chromatiales bacterium]
MTEAASRTKQEGEDASAALLAIVRQLSAEIHHQDTSSRRINLDSALDHDAGLDSLARAELLARIEKHFGITLPERAFTDAQTPRDLLRMLGSAETATTGTAVRRKAEETTQDGEATVPHAAQTLIDVLEWHVENHPDRRHIHFEDEPEDKAGLTFGQLWHGARAVAAGLRQRGIQKGEPVVIMLPSDRDYFFSFFGVLLAGGIPVPIYPPARRTQIADHIQRHKRILENCLAVSLITFPEAKRVAQLLKVQVDTLRHVLTVSDLASPATAFSKPDISPRDCAFIQYTSGSTGNPKGVVLSHANLLANIRVMGETVNANASDVFVSWLPLYHDMGLIGAWFGSLYYSALFVVMSPVSFITRPQRWLWAIHRHRGTLSASPNFGYELCLKRLSGEDIQGLDLSSWRAAFNGAEAISPRTLQRFHARFGPLGLRREALMPVYGLAECTVGLAFPPPGRGPVIDTVQREPFTRDGIAKPAADGDATAIQFVACGSPLPGHQVRIVDPAGRELPDRHEGRLQFRGPSATQGYFRNPEETRRLFDGEWLNSGDLAYIADGDIYITGRTKDVIIRAGRNLYPHELEEVIGNIPSVRTGRVAAFGSADPATQTERLVIMAETHVRDTGELEKLRSEINAAISSVIGTPADDVILAPPGTILKTSSGKIRRAACREIYEQGKIHRPAGAVWWQIARLAGAGMMPQLRRLRRAASTTFYGLYARALFWMLTPAVWLLVVALPRPAWRWKIMRLGVGLLARGTGTRITLRGLENLPPMDEPCVYVANHASYLDGPLAILALNRQFSFVAKSELEKTIFSHLFLRRIGTKYVERFDAARGVEDSKKLVAEARSGTSLFFFPEGTFTRKPGLLPFHLGAFIVAAEAGAPVVPIAIRGTRSIYRAGSWLPARGSISVIIGKPVDPRNIAGLEPGDPWKTAIALRDAARHVILKNCGEPDLKKEGSPLREP